MNSRIRVRVIRQLVSHGPLRVRVPLLVLQLLTGTSTSYPWIHSCHGLGSRIKSKGNTKQPTTAPKSNGDTTRKKNPFRLVVRDIPQSGFENLIPSSLRVRINTVSFIVRMTTTTTTTPSPLVLQKLRSGAKTTRWSKALSPKVRTRPAGKNGDKGESQMASCRLN